MNRVTINIGGKERELIASMANIMSIERELNCSIFKIVSPFLLGKPIDVVLSYDQMAVIIFNGLRGLPDNPLQKESIQKALLEDGYIDHFNTCLSYLISCVTGTKKKEEGNGSGDLLPQSQIS